MGFYFVVNLQASEIKKFDAFDLAYSYYEKTAQKAILFMNSFFQFNSAL